MATETIKIDFTTNNITYKDGDSLIITFNGAFNKVSKFLTYSEVQTPESSSTDYLMTNIRWSTDDQVWSAWQQLSIDPTGNKTLPSALTTPDFASGSNISLQFKYIRVQQNPDPTVSVNRTLNSVTITLDPDSPESSYTAPPARICPTGDYFKGIKVDCEGGLFRVYDLMAPAIDLNRELALAISEMFGHQVCYFKTTADQKSKDFILKEYSLYNVTDVKNVRIVVPDNVFPDNAIQFTPFDMDFESPFEVQIVKEDFEKAFGYCVRPEERDYLYFPLENRLYEIQSAYLFKDFMRSSTYYKVALWKFQDKDNVMRAVGSTAQTLTDSLTENFDDLFKESNELEFKQITKPLQYNTINVGDWDFVRSEIDQKLNIKKNDINNYFTIVAKYTYDLNTVVYNDNAVIYKTPVSIGSTEDRVYISWFRTNRTNFNNTALGPTSINEYPIGSTMHGLKYDTMLDGWVAGTAGTTGPVGPSKGIQINLQYGPTSTGATSTYSTQGIEVKVNDDIYNFDNNYLQPWPDDKFPNLLVDAKQYNQTILEDSRKWYALVLNVSNTHGTINCNVWEMEFDATKPAYTQQSTQLKLVFGETKTFNKQTVNSGSYYKLKGVPLEITNLRILTELINEENQPLMLNRYTVRDNQYAEMIDNALPPLRMTRGTAR